VYVGDEGVDNLTGFPIDGTSGFSFQYPQTQPATQRFIYSQASLSVLVYEDTPYSTNNPVPVPVPIQFPVG